MKFGACDSQLSIRLSTRLDRVYVRFNHVKAHLPYLSRKTTDAARDFMKEHQDIPTQHAMYRISLNCPLPTDAPCASYTTGINRTFVRYTKLPAHSVTACESQQILQTKQSIVVVLRWQSVLNLP